MTVRLPAPHLSGGLHDATTPQGTHEIPPIQVNPWCVSPQKILDNHRKGDLAQMPYDERVSYACARSGSNGAMLSDYGLTRGQHRVPKWCHNWMTHGRNLLVDEFFIKLVNLYEIVIKKDVWMYLRISVRDELPIRPGIALCDLGSP